VNATKNATRHAEIVAIDQILLHSNGRFGADVFKECQLVVTCEPCIMCAAALLQLHVGIVYFGCSNERFGGCGSVLRLHDKIDRFSGYPVVSGICKQEAIQLLKKFYLLENKNAPKPAAKKKKTTTDKKEYNNTLPSAWQ